MLRVLLSALLFALWLPAKPPITHEALWLVKRVGAPVPSPDGKWVVMPVTEPAYDQKDQVSDLWIVPADGSAQPRRLTSTKGGESGVNWSPESTKIVFSAKREGDEVAQIYLLDIKQGGEAVRLTSLSTGAESPRISPDGRQLAFTSMVYPGAADDAANAKIAAERRARKYNARVYVAFPIRNWDRWLDDRQAHLFVQSLEPGTKPRDLMAGSSLVDGAGYSGHTTDSGQSLQAVWAPDSASLVFVATANRSAAAYAHVDYHLHTVPAAGGEPRRLTSGDVTCSSPHFRPDGKALYFTMERRSRIPYAIERLVMMPWPGAGEPVQVAPGFDRSVNSFAFTPDSARIFFTAEDAGLEVVYSVPASGGQAANAFEMKLGAYTGLRIPEKASEPLLIAAWESAVNPPEAVRIDAAAGRHRNLTSFNVARMSDLDLPPLEHFWFTAKNGRKIHSMLAFPPAFDKSKKYPLFVVMHGGPHSMWRDQWVLRWNYHLLAAPGYVVLLTNYTGSTGFGEKFAQLISGDPLRGPAGEISEAADEAIRRYPFIDATRQAAGGASYGGHLANWMQASTTRYKCLISHAGLINLESQWGTSDNIYHRELNAGGPPWEQSKVWREQNPIRYAKNFRTPILVTVGENDFRVPLNQSIENWSVLQRQKVPCRLVVFPEENHWILKGEDSRFFYQEVHAWLAKYLR
jgi:dipeptidyl aminopeptidase/acylaminoacyl peptidase